ncbi:hypothetical protein J6590_057705 [Homalodisca vitripennis]|nr:hypothetical protein J6590_057705 [Homalodisca vitripennis]
MEVIMVNRKIIVDLSFLIWKTLSKRWYRKIADERLLGTAVVIALLAYKNGVEVTGQRRRSHVYSIKTSREKILNSVCNAMTTFLSQQLSLASERTNGDQGKLQDVVIFKKSEESDNFP